MLHGAREITWDMYFRADRLSREPTKRRKVYFSYLNDSVFFETEQIELFINKSLNFRYYYCF